MLTEQEPRIPLAVVNFVILYASSSCTVITHRPTNLASTHGLAFAFGFVSPTLNSNKWEWEWNG